MNHFDLEGCLCIRLALQERDISPRHGTMTPRNQNNVLHLNFQSKPSGEGKPVVDMLDHTLSKISARKGVLTRSIYRKIQNCTSSPRSVQKRNLLKIIRAKKAISQDEIL